MITRPAQRHIAATALLAVISLAGCEGWASDPVARPGGDGQPAPVQPEPVYSNDVAPSGPPPGAWQQPPPPPASGDPDRRDVPDDARLVAEGKGVIQFRAVRDGEVFVVDADRDELLWKGQINRGEMLSIEPDGNRMLINQTAVYQQDIKKKDKHKVFFLRQ